MAKKKMMLGIEDARRMKGVLPLVEQATRETVKIMKDRGKTLKARRTLAKIRHQQIMDDIKQIHPAYWRELMAKER